MVKETTISASARGKKVSRERRAICAFFIAIGATSERFSLLRDALDNVFHVPRSKHIVASSLGFLPGLTTSDRHDKELLRDFFSRIDQKLMTCCCMHCSRQLFVSGITTPLPFPARFLLFFTCSQSNTIKLEFSSAAAIL